MRSVPGCLLRIHTFDDICGPKSQFLSGHHQTCALMKGVKRNLLSENICGRLRWTNSEQQDFLVVGR